MPLWTLFSANKKHSLVALLMLLFSAAGAQQRKKVQVASCRNRIIQGVTGLVFEVRGNQMPAPGKGVQVRHGTEKVFGIFLPANLETAQKGHKDCFFKKPGSQLVKMAKTDKNGCFSLALMPGRYSIFVKENREWYANSFDGEGGIFPFEVFPDSLTHLDFRINHGAWY